MRDRGQAPDRKHSISNWSMSAHHCKFQLNFIFVKTCLLAVDHDDAEQCPVCASKVEGEVRRPMLALRYPMIPCKLLSFFSDKNQHSHPNTRDESVRWLKPQRNAQSRRGKPYLKTKENTHFPRHKQPCLYSRTSRGALNGVEACLTLYPCKLHLPCQKKRDDLKGEKKRKMKERRENDVILQSGFFQVCT